MKDDLNIRDAEVPEIIYTKIDQTLDSIRLNAESKRGNTIRFTGRSEKRSFFRKPAAIIIAACLLVLTGATVFAAANHFWSDGAQELIKADPEQQLLESRERVTYFEKEDDHIAIAGGISIRPMELVFDRYNARFTFFVTGIGTDVTSVKDLCFNESSLDFDGEISGAACRFYDEEITTEGGEKGLELLVFADDLSRRGMTVPGKTCHLVFEDLRGFFGTDAPMVAEGRWEFSIPIPDNPHMLTYEFSEELEAAYVLNSIRYSVSFL